VISDVANPFFAELAGEIQRAAAAEAFPPYSAIPTRTPMFRTNICRRLLAGSRVDGVILVPAAAMTAGLEAAGQAKARLVFSGPAGGDGRSERGGPSSRELPGGPKWRVERGG